MKPEDLKYYLKLAKTASIVSGAFIAVVSILLIANLLQTKSIAPIDNPHLQELVVRLSENPSDEALREHIRALDLLSRKAYFTNQWQLKTGGYLLLISTVILLVSARFIISQKGKQIVFNETFNEWEIRFFSRKWVLYSAIALFTLAIIAGVVANNEMNKIPQLNPEYVKADLPTDKGDTTKIAETPSSTSDEIITEVAEDDMPTDQDATSDADVVLAEEDESVTAEDKNEPVEAAKPALVKFSAETYKSNFPNFRGFMAQGIDFHKNIPTDWDGQSGKKVVWKVKVPRKGFSSPVIWGEKIFVTGADATAREIYCYNKKSGQLMWTAQANNIEGSPSEMPETTDDTGLAAPTVACDGNGVYAIFGTGDLLAVDLNGKRLWAKNIRVPDNHYGHSSSLITHQNKLIVQFDDSKGANLMAFSPTDGKELWNTKRSTRLSWATPVIATLNNITQIILTTEPVVSAYNINDGTELWKVECMMGEVGPSVAIGGGLIFAANEYAMLAAIDPATHEIVWQADEYLPEASSPVATEKYLIIATSYGVVACYDVKTGDKLWEQDYGVGFYASPIVAEGKVYLMDMKGTMHIIEVGDTYKALAEPSLGEKSTCTPAFQDGFVFIRGNEHLYCIGK